MPIPLFYAKAVVITAATYHITKNGIGVAASYETITMAGAVNVAVNPARPSGFRVSEQKRHKFKKYTKSIFCLFNIDRADNRCFALDTNN